MIPTRSELGRQQSGQIILEPSRFMSCAKAARSGHSPLHFTELVTRACTYAKGAIRSFLMLRLNSTQGADGPVLIVSRHKTP